MEFNYFDLVVTVIILLLGLKGVLNGFFKELFGLIGIIGGIFVASRVGESVGTFLNENIFHFESQAAVSFAGFLLTLALFWLGMIGLGHLFKKLGALSGLGGIDRLLGFAIGSGKFFLIAAVIAYAAYNIKAVRDNIEAPLKSSVTFPILVATGSYIMHLDPEEMQESAKTAVANGTKSVEAVSAEQAEKVIESVKSTLGENTDKEGAP